MVRYCVWLGVFVLTVAGCAGTGQKVLQDFGIQERPEGYLSGADKVMEKLPEVAQSEMTRLNASQRQGEILYEKKDSLDGAYYKRTKIYETARPLDAHVANQTRRDEEIGYVGYIEFGYQFHESARKLAKTEAAALTSDIPTGIRGQETYRYRFNSGSEWNGAKGEPFKE